MGVPSIGGENLTCRRFRNLHNFTLPTFNSDGVSCGKPPCTAPSLKTCLNVEIFIEQLLQFRVLSKMMLQAHPRF